MEMRDVILGFLSIFEQNAHSFVLGEPSKALYRARTRRLLKRLSEKRERGKDAGGQVVSFKVGKFEVNVKEKERAK